MRYFTARRRKWLFSLAAVSYGRSEAFDMQGGKHEQKEQKMATLLVKNIDTLYTNDTDLGDIKDGAIFVRDNVRRWPAAAPSR